LDGGGGEDHLGGWIEEKVSEEVVRGVRVA
jgi:hypothetical protein